jgi:CelD/BcsL family acetyltransferase involved in cellulose biosynthesis
VKLESIDSLEEVGEDWARLAERSRNPFATPEWIAAWWHHFGRQRPLRVASCRDDVGELRAILPLYLWRRRPLRMLRFVGHGLSDELGPICAPDDRAFAVAALARALDRDRAAVLIGDDLVGTWPGLRGHVLGREASPVLRFTTSGWDDYLATRSRKFRSLVRYTLRRLERLHDVRYRLADPSTIEADLETVFALHEARWGSRSDFAVTRSFHRDFAAVAAARGWLRLWLLELDGRAVSAWYGFRFASTESYYQSGRDRTFDHLSVGLALVTHSIAMAQADGVEEYRFLRGGEQYKFRFATEDPGAQTVALAPGRMGTLAVEAAAAVRAARRVAAKGRRLVQRRR